MPLMRGLYALTPDALCAEPEALLRGVEAALRGGAALIQYRDKTAAAPARRARAQALLALCRRHRVPLIVNDDVELAAAIGAGGAHVGGGDMPVAVARAALGPQAIIGVSCASDLARAGTALAAGASYVAFGRFFDSRTKPGAPQAVPDLLRAARARLPEATLCAIGGITPANAAPLIAQGADLIAAVDGVFGAADIEQAARAYAGLFG
jgi:thiamine-phosphate pyrophosphorylase